MTTHPSLTRRQAITQVLFAVAAALICAGLVGAAALVPAPHVILPFVIVVGIGVPMAVAADLPRAIAALRRDRAIAALRRHLARLPETAHPLDR
jgi:cyanate permease